MMNISLSTMARRKREKGNFDTALKQGKYKALAEVENSLFRSAKKGNIRSIIFYLKNRDPEHWKDKMETTHDHQINLSQIIDDAKKRVIDVKPASIEADAITEK